MEFFKNYSSFSTNERSNVFYDVILESIIVYKDKLKELLREMETPMSKEILDIEGKDIDSRNNYFDASKTNDAISFVPDRKYQDILKTQGSWILLDPTKIVTPNVSKYPKAKKIWDDLGLEIPTEVKLEIGIKGRLGGKTVTIAGKTKSYNAFYPLDTKYTSVPVNTRYVELITKEKINAELSKNAQEIKAGRGMKALLMSSGIIKTDKEIEEFVNKFKSTYDVINNAFRFFDIVEGEDIRKYYNEKNYDSQKNGQLGNSCMKKGHCGDFLDIYCLNPEKAKLVVLRAGKTEKIKGRAILWKLKDPVEGCQMFLDRIYTNDDSDINLFIEFSKKNGWICKKSQSAGKTLMILPSGKEIKSENFSVEINPIKYRAFPYLDTFRFYIPSIGILTTDEYYNKEMCLILTTTNGSYEFIRRCKTCADGHGRIYCDKCRGNGNVQCKECTEYGKVVCSECCIPVKDLVRRDPNTDERIVYPKFVIGADVETNADSNGVSSRVTSGKISSIGNSSFSIDGNWGVGLNNRRAWIKFINKEEPQKNCDKCNGRNYTTCVSCKGAGNFKCDKCDGKGFEICPDCSRFININQ